MDYPGKSDSDSQNLPLSLAKNSVNHQPENQGICPGCQEPAEITDPTTCIPECTHRFHEECLTPWFKKDSSCPICRSKINVYYLMAGRTVKVPKAKKGNKNSSRWNQGVDGRMIEYDSQEMGEDDEQYHGNENQLQNSEESVIIFSSGEHSERDQQDKISSGSQSQDDGDEDSKSMNSEESQSPKRLRTRSRLKRLRRHDDWKLEDKRGRDEGGLRQWSFVIDDEQQEKRQKKENNRGSYLVQKREASLQRESHKGILNIRFLNGKNKKKR